MEGKNGIIIDGIFHELKESKKKDCRGCSLYDLCKKEFGSACVCWIGLESKSIDSSGMFFNRGKVKVVKTLVMPIKPENRSRYPKDWNEIRQSILERAKNKCEFCGVGNHSIRLNTKTGKVVKTVLTIAHMNHEPEDCRPENLKALCQMCHNRYDAKHRAETRRNNIKKR